MSRITIHDTMGGRPVRLDAGHVRIYLCGVTTYDDTHIGHARTIIIFDVLCRYLRAAGMRVTLIQNFTDVDDKIIRRAAAEGRDPLELGESYILRYHEDFDRLNVGRADAYPRATCHIPEMIKMISTLIESGHAYVADSGVYYTVESFSGYGALSKKNLDEMRAGSRIEPQEDKHDPADFALWKRADAGPVWESPWGKGRPGWHIECSAMSLKYLGENFEIHGGGRDLIFPHHENEIAQTYGCAGAPLARIWMHTGMVTISGQKMSKSLGNVRSTRSILDRWGPNVVRLFCLSGQYRKPIDYSAEMLSESLVLWRRLESCFYTLEQAAPNRTTIPCEDFDAALANDFDTHRAIGIMSETAKGVGEMAAAGRLSAEDADRLYGRMSYMMGTLGLRVRRPDGAALRSIAESIEERGRLRRAGRYGEADAIRGRLASSNVELLDYKDITVWVCHEESGDLGTSKAF